jgi:uncharacterized protein YkwD
MLALFFSVHGLVSEQSVESRMHELVNAARRNRDLDSLEVTDFLRGYAGERAQTLERRGRLLPHDACFGCGEVLYVTNQTTWVAFTKWMGSPGHYAILMDPDATRIGCGVEKGPLWDWWVCEVRF